MHPLVHLRGRVYKRLEPLRVDLSIAYGHAGPDDLCE
jgi:hypothetical protein